MDSNDAPTGREDLRQALRDRALLCDGGMGTQLLAAGLAPGDCGALWNVERPDAIEAVHRRYRDAGCDCITTNTFTASRTALTVHSLDKRAAEINHAAAAVARRAAGPGAWVLADVGPFGGFLEPLGDTTPDQLADIFHEQLSALKQGGADAAIIETMSDTAELAIAVKSAIDLDDWPVIATFAFQMAGDRFVTMMGTSVDTALKAAIDAGAHIVGANCGTGLTLEAYARLADELLAAAGGTPVILQPNAGAPTQKGGQDHYPATPNDMADLAESLIRAGIRMVGGCCGTTSDHLRAMAQRVHAASSPAARASSQ